MWMKTLLLTLVPFFLMASCSDAHDIDIKLKEALIRGHGKSCKPIINSQMNSLGLAVTQNQLENYCSCLGHKYFDSFTKSDLEYLNNTNSLPQRILINRALYQDQCSDNL